MGTLAGQAEHIDPILQGSIAYLHTLHPPAAVAVVSPSPVGGTTS